MYYHKEKLNHVLHTLNFNLSQILNIYTLVDVLPQLFPISSGKHSSEILLFAKWTHMSNCDGSN
jgi:hypothetical protein